MGAWGTGLWEEDLACDIQDEWNDLMDDGTSPRKATKELLSTWRAELSDYNDKQSKQADESILYISLAALQMRHQALTSSVKKKALHLIEQGADLALWEDGDQQDYQDRQAVLTQFKQKLVQAKASLF
ncbi:hypothetical protein JCM19046_1572 [Bacillus sp. JCM 19046]|nr:hypothetical protein JCM19046_1572 [Bacillus sp. JCM 19046]